MLEHRETHSPRFTEFGGSASNTAGSNGALGGSAGSMNSAGGGGQEMGGSAGGGGGDAALAGGGSGGGASDAAAFVPDVPEEYVGDASGAKLGDGTLQLLDIPIVH